ncbi:unnamed protein product [Prorocentrum cordatum]|uniref:Uncharacterized protein n=1 Tax=Prorocentrum cordatum TaxID=2364126 RepID=A0ABN9SJ63_9DINO|nr:unnamed protein product [Polarella glacialis]
MADVLTLDIGDPQILVHYPDDENGFLWHHRVLLFRVSDDIWISLTPDLALVRLKLLDIRHEVLERRAPFPAHLGHQVYAHDPIAAAALAGFRRRAKIQGQLLGVGQVDVVERMIWVVAEPRSARFGEVIDSAIMDDDARGTGFDTKGVAVVDGEEIFVQKIAASKLDDFKKETKADLGDVRTLGDHLDDAGQRCLRLSEAVALMRDTDQPNFPLAGVRSVKEFLESVASGPGNMTSYQAEWERLSGVGEGSAVNHVHRNLCEVIRLMHSWDQVDASMLASAELIVRWLVQTEIAVERNPRHPDYSGLDIVISAPVNAAGRATTNKFNSWVTDKLKERAQIWKQERLYREEQKTNLKEGKGGDGYDPSKKKLKKRGGKAGAEGAARAPREPPHGRHRRGLAPSIPGGIRSRDRRHGDPFPLPCDPSGLGSACSSARQRQVFDAVRALNQLAAANVNSRRAQGHDRAPEGHLRPTAVQQWMIQNILDSRDHYGMEPKNLASFDFDKVKILHRKVHVRPMRRELPASAAGYLRHASDLIEMDEAELERDRAEGVGVTPYWDPLLRRSRDLRKRLYQRLDQQGLLTWRRRLKGHAGIFVVKKKDGLQRLIIDARAANRAHRPPPTTRLGSSRCMADLDLSDPRLKASGFGGLGSGAFSPAGREGDVGDCFYNFTIPELASWFGFADRFDTRELTEMGCLPGSIWDDAEGAETEVVDGEQLYPCMCAVCMGWSWALYFANEAVTYRVQRALPDGAEKVMREMQPAPTIEPGKCVAGVYVDNVQVIGGCEADANTQMHKIENLFREDRVPFDVEPGNSLEMQSLGLVYHWRERRLRHVARRVWRTYMAGHALLRRRKLHGHTLQCWLGHVVNLNQLCPEAMSALNACYRFIEESLESPKRVWPSVKSEIRCSMNLLFLMEADLGATYSDQVYCGDSSGRGYALHVTTAEPTELREAWKWRERWRYRDVPTVTGHVSSGLDYVRGGTPGTASGPRTAFGQSLLSQAEAPEGASGLAPSPARSRAVKPARGRTQLHLDSGIPALGDSWVARRRYKLVAADRWRWQDEHINLKEARVALMGLRRHCRSVKFMGTKLLSISDSQVTVGAFEKGRSSAGLQALCRRAAAYRLGGQISWRLRYIETDRNPSDEDSRRWDLKKPAGLNRGPERRDAAPSLSALAASYTTSSSSRSPPSASSASVVRPSIQSEPGKSVFCMELFGGKGELTRACLAEGLPFADSVDIRDGWEFDLSRRSTQEYILRLAREGRLIYVHLGTPCQVWSIARRGIRNHVRARARERLGIEFALFTATLCHILSRRGCYWSVENPRTSRLWSFDPIARLHGLADVVEVNFDMSMYGTAYRKPTRILTNLRALQSLGDRPRIRHKHSVLLHGHLTPLAAAYPPALGSCWARLLSSALPGDIRPGQRAFDPSEVRHGLRRAAGRRPAARGASVHGEVDEPREPACQAADSFLEHDPIIQFGQDERPRRWRAHPDWAAAATGEGPTAAAHRPPAGRPHHRPAEGLADHGDGDRWHAGEVRDGSPRVRDLREGEAPAAAAASTPGRQPLPLLRGPVRRRLRGLGGAQRLLRVQAAEAPDDGQGRPPEGAGLPEGLDEAGAREDASAAARHHRGRHRAGPGGAREPPDGGRGGDPDRHLHAALRGGGPEAGPDLAAGAGREARRALWHRHRALGVARDHEDGRSGRQPARGRRGEALAHERAAAAPQAQRVGQEEDLRLHPRRLRARGEEVGLPPGLHLPGRVPARLPALRRQQRQSALPEDVERGSEARAMGIVRVGGSLREGGPDLAAVARGSLGQAEEGGGAQQAPAAGPPSEDS